MAAFMEQPREQPSDPNLYPWVMAQICQGFNVFLSFAVKPGLPLEQVQQGVTEVIDELGYRLGSFLNEKDLQSNADKYEVAEQTNQNHCYRFDRGFFSFFWWNISSRKFQDGYGSTILQDVPKSLLHLRLRSSRWLKHPQFPCHSWPKQMTHMCRGQNWIVSASSGMVITRLIGIYIPMSKDSLMMVGSS